MNCFSIKFLSVYSCLQYRKYRITYLVMYGTKSNSPSKLGNVHLWARGFRARCKMAICPQGNLAIDPFLIGLDKSMAGLQFNFVKLCIWWQTSLSLFFLTENSCCEKEFINFFGEIFSKTWIKIELRKMKPNWKFKFSLNFKLIGP